MNINDEKKRISRNQGAKGQRQTQSTAERMDQARQSNLAKKNKGKKGYKFKDALKDAAKTYKKK